MRAALTLLMLACASTASAQAPEPEVIAEIRVHGNHTTPDADVLSLSGLAVGLPATEARLRDAEQMLRTSDRFTSVEVRRRYLSIEDATKVLVVLVVDERAGVSQENLTPGPLRRLSAGALWLPVLNYLDGYGFTYGVRFGFVDPLGPRTHLGVPLTWGGERRAGAELERTFERGPVSTIRGSVSTYRRVNPHFDIPDVRVEARARTERALTTWLRAGAAIRTARVDFGGTAERHTAAGLDVVVDTRLDPSFPRNAVHTEVGWERLAFPDGSSGRWFGDLRGYVGVGGSNVLALRAHFVHASDAVPPSEQTLLGGGDSLRGYRTGHRAGDSMSAVSAELRVPLNSPFSFGRFGVKAFIDAGTTWSSIEPLSAQRFDHGIGGGVYFGVAALSVNVDVAKPESGSPRAHVGVGLTF